MRRALQIGLPILVLSFGVGGAGWLVMNQKKAAQVSTEPFRPNIRVATVAPQDFVPVIRVHGTVRPRTSVSLMPQISGKVVAMSPALIVGGLFREGDELVRVDALEYELSVKQTAAEIRGAQAGITNALAQISSARAAKAQAEARLVREEAEAKAARSEWALLGRAGEPPELLVRGPQIREAKASLAAAAAQNEAAHTLKQSSEAKLEAAWAASEKAQLNVDRCVIDAPFSGRVQQVNFGLGQVIAPGITLAQLQPVDFADVHLALSLVQFDHLDLPKAFRGGTNIVGGPVVRLSATAGAPGKWQGRVARTMGEVDSATRMMTLIAQVKEPYSAAGDSNGTALSFGRFVKAEIDGKAMSNVMVLPRSVLRGEGKVHVYNDGTLKARSVTTAWSTRDVVVISAGLREGEQVSLTPVEAYVEGMLVNVGEKSGE